MVAEFHLIRVARRLRFSFRVKRRLSLRCAAQNPPTINANAANSVRHKFGQHNNAWRFQRLERTKRAEFCTNSRVSTRRAI
jgi:hypothetical protein